MRNTLTLLLDRHVDVAFCTSFWSLQRHFQQPDKVVETESSWNHLVDIIEQVLRAFENSTTNTSDSITDCSDYYPKFLTSPYLLNLEVILLLDNCFRTLRVLLAPQFFCNFSNAFSAQGCLFPTPCTLAIIDLLSSLILENIFSSECSWAF